MLKVPLVRELCSRFFFQIKKARAIIRSRRYRAIPQLHAHRNSVGRARVGLRLALRHFRQPLRESHPPPPSH